MCNGSQILTSAVLSMFRVRIRFLELDRKQFYCNLAEDSVGSRV